MWQTLYLARGSVFMRKRCFLKIFERLQPGFASRLSKEFTFMPRTQLLWVDRSNQSLKEMYGSSNFHSRSALLPEIIFLILPYWRWMEPGEDLSWMSDVQLHIAWCR